MKKELHVCFNNSLKILLYLDGTKDQNLKHTSGPGQHHSYFGGAVGRLEERGVVL